MLDAWEEHAAGNLGSIDGERLASLCLRIRLQHGVVDASLAQEWESADSYVRGRMATNSAHDIVPPLFVSVAQAWLSAGQPERALALLEWRRSEANATQDDDATVRHAEAAIAWLVRRLRLADQRALLDRLTDPGRYRSEASRMWVAMLDDARRAYAVVHREPPPRASADTDRLAGWHAWWQCQSLSVPDSVPQPPWSPQELDADLPGLLDIQADLKEFDIQADLEETELLRRLGLERVRRQLGERLLLVPRNMRRRVRSADPYHDVRVDLRWAALDGTWAGGPPEGLPVPIRLQAEMAFSEAELLALRIPRAAALIYLIAADAYRGCGDSIGWLLALAGFHDALSGCRDSDRPRLLELAKGPMVDTGTLGDAHRAVGECHLALAAILAGPLEEAGPWRYWAQTLQRLTGGPPETGQGTTAPPAASPEAPPAATARAVSAASENPSRCARGACGSPRGAARGRGSHRLPACCRARSGRGSPADAALRRDRRCGFR